MPQRKKDGKKPKKGASSIEISPLKETVTRRRAAVDKNFDNDESQKTTPSKTPPKKKYLQKHL